MEASSGHCRRQPSDPALASTKGEGGSDTEAFPEQGPRSQSRGPPGLGRRGVARGQKSRGLSLCGTRAVIGEFK